MIKVKNKDKITLDFGINNYTYSIYMLYGNIFIVLYLNMNFVIIYIFIFNINTYPLYSNLLIIIIIILIIIQISRVHVARDTAKFLDNNFFIQYLLCIKRLLKKEILHV